MLPRVDMPTTAPAAGNARVVLHTTDGPMRVEARADLDFVPPGSNAPPTRFGELCVTPCVVDLPPGKYKLYLTSADGGYARGDVDNETGKVAVLPANSTTPKILATVQKGYCNVVGWINDLQFLVQRNDAGKTSL